MISQLFYPGREHKFSSVFVCVLGRKEKRKWWKNWISCFDWVGLSRVMVQNGKRFAIINAGNAGMHEKNEAFYVT